MTIPFYTDLEDFTIIPNFQGEWYFRTVYIAGSLVNYNGRLYEAKTLVDQSSDAVVIGHDDFHRPDVAEGWGTASDGTPWIVLSEGNPNEIIILDNIGIVRSAYGGIIYGVLAFGDTELTTENLEIILQFSITGTLGWSMDLICRTDLDYISGNYISIGTNLTYNYMSETIYSYNDVAESNGYNFVPPSLPITAGVNYLCRFQASGITSRAKLWQESQPEPSEWDVSNVIDIVPLNNFVIVDFLAQDALDTVFHISEFTILALPDAPDINTTDWLLIG